MDVPRIVEGTVRVPPGWWGNGPDLAAPRHRPAAGVRSIGLVGCSKRKQAAAGPLPAAELYTGALFRRGYRHSRARHDLTLILSGRWSLVAPDALLAPYDYVLPQRQAIARVWATHVLGQLDAIWRSRGTVREVHFYAGKRYVEPILAVVDQRRLFPAVIFHWPVQGLAIQEQVRWFDAQGEREYLVPPAPDGFPEECPTGQAGLRATRRQRHCAGCRHIQHAPHPRCTWPEVAPEHVAAIEEMKRRRTWQPQLPGL